MIPLSTPTIDLHGIDWYSFLARPRLPPPPRRNLDAIGSKTILVTGAGGSIGRALSLRLAALDCPRLLLLENSEPALFKLQSDLARSSRGPKCEFVLGSATDPRLMDQSLADCQPELIFHAAAYKHVPLLEKQPLAAIANNTLGTESMAQIAERHGACRIVLLSTDKAVNPSSILGATKRIAEQIVLAHSGVALRLCNVIASAGSVVESLLDQIEAGGPVLITHPDAQRYFVTCEEAVDLLLAAALYAPPASVFIPALTRATPITSLADFLIATYSHSSAIEKNVVGLRPGDKIAESLYSADESPVSSQSQGIIELRQQSPAHLRLFAYLEELANAVSAGNLHSALEIVRALVPGYQPSSTLIALAHKSPLTAVSH